MTNKSGIYAIRSLDSGKKYIGSTKSFKNRWAGHRTKLRAGKHANNYLQNSWDKYGEDRFVFEVIEEVEKTNLLVREQWYLDNVVKWRHDYNINRLANMPPSWKGRKHSEKTKMLMSLNNPMRGLFGDKHPCYRIGDEHHLHGKTGSSCFNSIFTDDEVISIRKRYADGDISQYELAEEWGCSQGGLWDILHGRTYPNLPLFEIENRNKKMSDGDVLSMVERHKSGDYTGVELSKIFGVTPTLISAILNGRARASVTGFCYGEKV